LATLGFEVVATAGTAAMLEEHGVKCDVLIKQHLSTQHEQDNLETTVAAILSGDIALVVNTPYGTGARVDGYEIRTAAVVASVPSITTIQGLIAAVAGIEARRDSKYAVTSLQEYAVNQRLVQA
jgi:carbamoyl-phosphate synthase large subunit